MKALLRKVFASLGYDIVAKSSHRSGEFSPDLSTDEREIWALIEPYTMTSVERSPALMQATRHVVENNIEGDIAECGVWRGGSMMAVAETLRRMGETTRRLFLYDTFEGMTSPGERDLQFDGQAAGRLLERDEKGTGMWCYAEMQEVRRNLATTGYPSENITLVQGKVEYTIPATMPEKIALLRLDTDWYESTRHELVHLYPRLASGGILIIDDYGHWQGAKQATDEYFASLGGPLPFLHRIDYTGRLLVKP